MNHDIGLIFNDSLPGIEKHALAVLRKLTKAGAAVSLLPHQARLLKKPKLGVPQSALLKKVRLLICIGGDGTTLRAARLSAPYEIPVLGIHVGTFGFLTGTDMEQFLRGLSTALPKILKGDFEIDERNMLEAEVVRKGKTVAKFIALNEVVISKSGIARLIRLEAYVDGERINTYAADGLIFATPTGSTGHSLSAGGPLLTSDLPAIVMTAICPHSFSHRPIVISSRHADDLSPAILSVKLIRPPRDQKVSVTADGQETVALQDGDEVLIHESIYRTRFVRLTPYSFFETLRRKFNLGR